MGSLQSSVLGYGIFRSLSVCWIEAGTFSELENVMLQTVAVATATMPLAGGFVGIIPALKMLEPEEGRMELSAGQLMIWAAYVPVSAA